jgi:hypothetical protein
MELNVSIAFFRCTDEADSIKNKKNQKPQCWVPMAHTYNPSYLGGKGKQFEASQGT